MTISRRAFLGASALALVPAVAKGQRLSSPARGDFPSTDTAPPPPLDRFDPWVEVLPHHLHHNVAEVARLSGDRPILAVVKNNAYGLDLATVGRLLEPHSEIQGFAVVKEAEALTLRGAGVTKPILLMGRFSPESGVELARAGIQLSLFGPDAPQRIEAVAREVGRPVDAHLYLDTGMGRMGMPYRVAGPWMAELAEMEGLRIRGVFTELGEDSDFDPEQLRRFREVTEGAARGGMRLGPLHAASSNGVFHFPDAHLDMVRPGIALFGSYPSRPQEERGIGELKAAVRLRARVVRVARLQEGDGVGYGRPWIAPAPSWTATLPVGHADGYPREAVEGAEVLINGRLFPIIGGVSASHCIAYLGDAAEGEDAPVRVGDTVTFMGPDDPAVDANNMAEKLGVSVYDLLMHLNPSLPRFPVSE